MWSDFWTWVAEHPGEAAALFTAVTGLLNAIAVVLEKSHPKIAGFLRSSIPFVVGVVRAVKRPSGSTGPSPQDIAGKKRAEVQAASGASVLLCLALLVCGGCSATAQAKATANLLAEVGDTSGPLIERACIRAYEPLAAIADDERRKAAVAEVDVLCHPETGKAIRAHATLVAVHAALVATILAIEAGASCDGRPCDLDAAQAKALDAVKAIGQTVAEVQR